MEWLTFGLSALCALGSFIGFLLAQREKKEAKKSEIAAKEYAENANKANIEIHKFTRHLNEEIDSYMTIENEQTKVKQFLIERYSKNADHLYGFKNLFQDLYAGNGDQNQLLIILKRLATEGFLTAFKSPVPGEFGLFRINRDF